MNTNRNISTRKRKRARRDAGFNLVEIALAVFVLSIGLLSIFGLFPHGLGMADMARQDTQSGMFADVVFGALRAHYAAEQSWPASGSLTLEEIKSENGVEVHRLRHVADGRERLVQFPSHDQTDRHPTYLRYELILGRDGRIGTATLRVWPGRDGPDGNTYYSEFYPFREVEP